MLNLVNTIWSKVKNSKIFWAAVVALALFLTGYGLGRHHKVPVKVVEHTVVDQITNQKLQEALKTQEDLKKQLTVAQNTITDLKLHQVTKIHIVHEKNGTTVEDKTVTTDENKDTDKTNNVSETTQQQTVVADNKTVDTTTQTHTESTTTITPLTQDRIYLGISGQLGLSGFSNPGIEAKYRLLTVGRLSGWAGAELIAPIPSFKWNETQFRLNLGISF